MPRAAWLTADDTTPGYARRVLLVPNEPLLAVAITGILTDLANPDNWEQFGEMTPEECAARFQFTLDEFLEGEECP